MPALGMAQDTGTLIRWLKKEGDQVAKGEPLMEVETDKATVEVEATASGILARVIAHDGDVIPVAQVIALILAPGEAAPEVSNAAPSGASRGEPPAAVMAASQGQAAGASPVALKVAEEHRVDISQVTPRDGARIKKADVLAYVDALAVSERPGPASPKARRLAAERGIDLGSIHGSGPEGAVLAVDVPAQSALPMKSPAPGETLEVSRAWRVMAERLSASWTEVPHFYLTREIDATRLIAWREASLAKTGEKITYTDLLVKAAAAALEQHPRVNSSWYQGQIALNSSINVGLAVATDDGLIVPVIHGTNQLTVRQIAAKRKALVERASAGKLRLDDLQGGTFTISNLGMYGIDAFNAIVNPPEAAILAVGRIADRVVPVDGQPAVRPVMVLTLSCDHRVIDGARGAQFLDTLVSIIEEPMRLID